MHESNETLKTLMEPNTQEELFSSQPACHANLPVLPGSERAQKMTVGSGRKLLGFYLNLKQNAPSLKTLSEYLLLKTDWYSRICFLKWKVKGTPYNRILYQLVPSVPSTDGIESGLLLATPQAYSHNPEKSNRLGQVKLDIQIKMLRTPSSHIIEAKSSVRKLSNRQPSDPQVGLADQINQLGEVCWVVSEKTDTRNHTAPVALLI